MHRSSESVQVATSTPLLRAVLIVVLLVSVMAGVLVAANNQVGWVALAFALGGGPAAVIAEGRSRSRSRAASLPRASVSESGRHDPVRARRPLLLAAATCPSQLDVG